MLGENVTMTSETTDPRSSEAEISFRAARPTDGAALWRVVKATGALELNSPYFYVLFATDFGDTCLLAEQAGEAVGCVIGYRPPREPDAAFVWQIGVLPSHRGRGLGSRMLDAWCDLPANGRCRWLTATVADDNHASQALFRRFARERGVRCDVLPHFTADLFPVAHPPEPIYRIGPLSRAAAVPC
jgi:L-2,4-diaminobutyric acid acetyltransferase